MGDMREYFDALKEYHKERRDKNYNMALEHEGLRSLEFVCHTDWHWQTILQGDYLDYWPSSSRWRWRGKTSRGTPDSLYNFIMRRTRHDSIRT
jgi:hypothetical protein